MNTDFSLIDSNLRRASEGLRVLDDSARFLFSNLELFVNIKTLRHALQAIEDDFGPARLIAARVGADVGAMTTSASEEARLSAWDIIRASSNRVAESLRILEEYAKIYAPRASGKIKNCRNALYTLEKELLACTPYYYLRQYFERGIIYPLSDNVEQILWLADHGAKIVQLRDKNNNQREIYSKANYLCQEIAARNKNQIEKILFILNDLLDIAAELPVSGVHLGQEDGDIAVARRRLGSNKIIGRSSHSIEQARLAVAAGADYVSIGPVYATPTKAGRGAVGLGEVAAVANEINIPWLAIGGIDKNTITAVAAAGAKNFAVVRSAKEFF